MLDRLISQILRQAGIGKRRAIPVVERNDGAHEERS